MYTVKSEAGVNTAETISSLHGFKQSLSGSFFFSTMNIKAAKHSQAMCSVPLQAAACSLFSSVRCFPVALLSATASAARISWDTDLSLWQKCSLLFL